MSVSQILLRRSLPLLLAVLLVTASVIFYAVTCITYTLDRNVREHSQFLVNKALDHRRSMLERSAVALLALNEISSNQHSGMPVPTAFYKRLGYGVLLSTDPHSETTWAFMDEPVLDAGQRERLNVELEALQEQARQAGPGVLKGGGLRIDDVLILAVATAAPSNGQATQGQALGVTLVLMDIVNPEELLQLGFEYGLIDLRALALDAAPKEASMAIEGWTGAKVVFGWSPPEFGREMLRGLLPAVVSSSVLLLLLMGMIARDAIKASRRLEESHAALLVSQASLAKSKERFRDIAEAASDWLWETDGQLRLVYLSERFEHITRHVAGQWLGRPLDELFHTERQDFTHWLASRSGEALRCRYSDRNGDERICRVASRPIMVGGRCVGYRGTANDITEEVKAQTQVEHLSLHDALTGLPNRNSLCGFFARKLEVARPFALLSLDLDRFKPVNDALGHAAGDHVLKEISLRLLNCTRDEDLVARLGGDEFIIVLDSVGTQESIEQLCARLIEQLKQPIIYEDQEIFIGGSIGIALAPQDAIEANELLRCADVALYQAKEDGRATWRFYASEMNQRLLQKRQMETELRQAMSAGEMKLRYHPRYRTNGMSIIGAEALVRWQHPQKGLLGPAHFIALAEETGLVVPLGRWVLNEACKEAARWPEYMVVSVNLSVVQFRQSDLLLDVQRALQGASLPASRLELEVTEGILLDESACALEMLNSLKELGIRLTMDQFGTGYSSFNYLRSYPFDGLKIDRSFISNLLNSAGDRSIIKAILGLAQALDIRVTAEGVETSEQLQWLEEENCVEVQGFHMSQPQSAEGLESLIHKSDQAMP